MSSAARVRQRVRSRSCTAARPSQPSVAGARDEHAGGEGDGRRTCVARATPATCRRRRQRPSAPRCSRRRRRRRTDRRRRRAGPRARPPRRRAISKTSIDRDEGDERSDLRDDDDGEHGRRVQPDERPRGRRQHRPEVGAERRERSHARDLRVGAAIPRAQAVDHRVGASTAPFGGVEERPQEHGQAGDGDDGDVGGQPDRERIARAREHGGAGSANDAPCVFGAPVAWSDALSSSPAPVMAARSGANFMAGAGALALTARPRRGRRRAVVAVDGRRGSRALGPRRTLRHDGADSLRPSSGQRTRCLRPTSSSKRSVTPNEMMCVSP